MAVVLSVMRAHVVLSVRSVGGDSRDSLVVRSVGWHQREQQLPHSLSRPLFRICLHPLWMNVDGVSNKLFVLYFYFLYYLYFYFNQCHQYKLKIFLGYIFVH